MRQLVLALALVLSGCASTPDPYPVAPQSVKVHFLSESEWTDFTTQRTLNGSWAMPGEIRGSARWERNDKGEIVSCDIYLPAGNAPSSYVLSHELRHCAQGGFH